MKATELRIGNLIQFRDGSIETVSELLNTGLIQKINDMYDTDYSQIPLTEEWLVKFGFAYKGDKYESMSLCFIRNGASKKDWFNVYSHIDGDFYSKYPITTVTFVHQLQNLYYALTGEELTIKEL